MKKFKLSEINSEKAFFHFTKKIGLENISQKGLEAVIGENSKGPENTPKVFFAQGKKGVMDLSDVWLKWLMNRRFGWTEIERKYNGDEILHQVSLWDQEFLGRRYLLDSRKKNEIFEKMFKDMNSRVYLVLDLKEGIDFSFEDIDEPKHSALLCKKNGNDRNYRYMKEFYGKVGCAENDRVEKFNLHTFPYCSVEVDKISQLISDTGKEDALSVLIEIYDKSPKDKEKFDLLDEFIEFSKEKLKNIKEESFESYTQEELSEYFRLNCISKLAKQINVALEKENASRSIDELEKIRDEISESQIEL